MNAKKQKGFTMMELVITMCISSIVILAGGAVLATSHKQWNKALNEVNLQRDGSYIMLELSRSIRSGTSAAIVDADGEAIKIYDNEGDWKKISIGTGGNDIKCEIEGQTAQTIIDRDLEGLQFNIESNKVTIDLKLKKDNQQLHLVSTVVMRNYGV
jgi:prepilin-type N-terminal cleavage/methylation domain-containing protein